MCFTVRFYISLKRHVVSFTFNFVKFVNFHTIWISKRFVLQVPHWLLKHKQMKFTYAWTKTRLLTCKSSSGITNGRPYIVYMRDALKLDTHSASLTTKQTLTICTSLIQKTFINHCKYLSCKKKKFNCGIRF